MKKRENPLDIPGDILYYNQARVQKEWAQYAMKREIAWQHGNFRRVCPVIGRLRTTICGRFTEYIAAFRMFGRQMSAFFCEAE